MTTSQIRFDSSLFGAVPGTLLAMACLQASCSAGRGDNLDEVGERRSHLYNAESEAFLVYEPDEKRNHPSAGDPDYVYLLIGMEAVRLEGPVLTNLGDGDIADLFAFHSPSVEVLTEVYPEGELDIGIDVIVNERLTYRFSIDDFEDEGSVIGSASLVLVGNELHSEFVFAATGSSGVAHEVSIQARIDAADAGSSTSPITIETRYSDSSDDACILGGNSIDEYLEPRRACEPGDECIILTAPGDCWHATVNAENQEEVDTIELEIVCGANCATATPSAAECVEGMCTLLP